LVEKPTVFKDSHDITDEFAQFGVLAIVYFSLDTRQIHWFFDHFVIVWNFVWIHGLLKRDATSISQKLFYESFDCFAILSCQLLLIRNVELGIGIASWTNVLFYAICLALKNAHATTMEPIRAVFAANIKPATIKKIKSQQKGLVTITLSITSFTFSSQTCKRRK